MMAKGRCRKCGKQFMYCSDTVERATKFLRNAIENHNYYNHPTLWQRVKAWWRK